MSEESPIEESPIEEYIKKTEEIIQHLKDKKIGDRLDLVSLIEEAITAVNASTLGWSAWLQHPKIMKTFTESELSEIAEGFRKLSSEFLELDIKWTQILKARKEAETIAKEKEPKKQQNKSGKQYIS